MFGHDICERCIGRQADRQFLSSTPDDGQLLVALEASLGLDESILEVPENGVGVVEGSLSDLEYRRI